MFPFPHPFFAKGGLDPDAQAYIDAMPSKPDSARSKVIEDYIIGLKLDGLWSDVIGLYLEASHHFSVPAINAKKPGTYNAALSFSPSSFFTVDRGFTPGAGVFDTGINVESLKGNCTALSYINGNFQNQSDYIFGCQDFNNFQFNAYFQNGTAQHYLKAFGLTNFGNSSINYASAFIGFVSNASGWFTLRNTSQLLTASAPYGTNNSTNTLQTIGFSGGQTTRSRIGVTLVAKAWTLTQIAAFNARTLTYLNAVGGA